MNCLQLHLRLLGKNGILKSGFHPASLSRMTCASSAVQCRIQTPNKPGERVKHTDLVPHKYSALKLWSPTALNAREFHVSAVARAGAGTDAAKLWHFERVVAASMLLLIPSAMLVYHPILDYLLSAILVMHGHWGLHGIVIDYLRPKIMGNALAKLSELVVYIFSAFAMGGIMYFNYTDVGLIHAIAGLWRTL
ncbi:unnamed protein product [Cyprideis torosa]|uniref:Succinate dehydrogenase [ubiquinone] cytochrome b small subunit n=1 Tax=Cyprideis torosa TaxID=163714 RepID=A0A7R8WGY2_9CRUS|nr:unnamed protein product [Cyprideis torosa]CAG0893142.1 unnamed protein product [Cyprideis torosa]